MPGRIRAHIRNNVVGYIALFVALGGVAYAGATIGSPDVIDNSLQSVDLRNNKAVKSTDVVDDTVTGGGLAGQDIAANALGGSDIDEGTLENVDAGTVGGLQIRKINFQVSTGTGPTTVLDLGGLQITAECQNFGDFLDVKAFTSKNNAIALYFGGNAHLANDTDGVQDIGSEEAANRDFDVGAQLQIDNASPPLGDEAIGTLTYSAPDGSVVVAQLALDEIRTPTGFVGCALTGYAVGG